jgi:probable F420-dependent oxidoreductase
VRLATLLPLGKVDPGLRTPETPLDIWSVAEDARVLEQIGYDGLVVEETKDDPFTILTLAAQATTRLQLGTSVAIAFPRSPTVMALNSWTLQKLSRGRFTLGLGTQVRGHIQRRYGVPWSPPAPWMREYVAAVRAVWDCWQNGTPLDVKGEHYNLDLMVPLFNAGPIEHPDIPIQLAAVNTSMCAVAGEVADGVRPHPVCTPSYIRSVMLPAVERGARRAGRSLERFRIGMKPLVATARTEADLIAKVRDARARIAFYASTPSYAAAFEHLGLGDLAERAKQHSKAQNWEALPALISDEVLHEFVTIGTYDTIGHRLLDRFGDLVTDIEFSIPVHNEEDASTLRDLTKLLRSSDTPSVDDPSVAEVIANELALLRPAVRSDRAAVLRLLHDSFREFGASGRTWDRHEIADALAAEPGTEAAEVEDMQAVRLSPDVILLTYRARRPDRTSLRSSVWVKGPSGWQLFFHQGTTRP